MAETSLCLRPSGEVYNRLVAHLVYTEEHVDGRLLHSACSNVPIMEQYLLQQQQHSLCNDYHKCNCIVFSYLVLQYSHREVFLKNANATLKSVQWLECVEWGKFLGLM